MTTLIKNGTVVSTTGRHEADVLIDGEKIAAILQPGTSAAVSAESGAEKVIDAKGKYVVPGGIDCHTHMELPFGGTFASDTFEIGTLASGLPEININKAKDYSKTVVKISDIELKKHKEFLKTELKKNFY